GRRRAAQGHHAEGALRLVGQKRIERDAGAKSTEEHGPEFRIQCHELRPPFDRLKRRSPALSHACDPQNDLDKQDGQQGNRDGRQSESDGLGSPAPDPCRTRRRSRPRVTIVTGATTGATRGSDLHRERKAEYLRWRSPQNTPLRDRIRNGSGTPNPLQLSPPESGPTSVPHVRNLLVIPLLAALIATAIPADAQQWELGWSDEFDTPGAPDPSKWTYDIGGHGWGNQELQYYTDRLENARVEDGVLIIEAREESFGGNDYTSARLVTRGLAAWQ